MPGPDDTQTVPDFLAEGKGEDGEKAASVRAPGGDPLLDDLTPEQREAALHGEGPALVLAAAGSGKTRVITRRIARLVRDGAPPWSVLALTFTNKAAGEMRERVETLLPTVNGGRGARGLTVTTFHSLCARLLRRYADAANVPGLKPDYAIYDSSDQQALVKRVIKDLHLSTTNWSPRAALSAISNAKNDLKDAKQYESEASDFYARTIAKIFTGYEAALRRANAVDFDDLLVLTVRALRSSPEALRECLDRWSWLMIDEYQDTNRAQFELTRLLSGVDHGGAANVCVVGDPDQSIYGWRGADIQNILDFESAFPGARVIKLGQNFRSTQPILASADALIKHNAQRRDKPLYTTSEGGEKPVCVTCQDERHEASLVVDWARALRDRDEPLAWREMAVFYRTNALSRVMEDAFRAAGVPHVIARGTAFYDREEIRDALAYLRLVANPADDVSLARIVNKPTRGLGKASLSRVERHAALEGVPMLEALRAAGAGAMGDGVSARAQNAAAKFVAMVDGWREHGVMMGVETAGSLQELVERVVRDSGLEGHYRKKTLRSGEPDDDRIENLDELINSAHEFDMEYAPENDPANEADAGDAPPLLTMLRAYLESIALVADADAVDPEQGAVTLMTLHASKGLEFDAVAIVGLEEGLLPHGRAQDSEADLEEERRLLFVGMTRARKRLHLSCARYRTHRGMEDRTIRSRFLEELPGEHVVFSDQAGGGWDEGSAALDDFGGPTAVPDESDELGGLREGAMVRHPRFGVGRVEAILSRGQHPRVRIAFRQAGTKTIVLGYAPLVPLE